jgi:hypothetical protein
MFETLRSVFGPPESPSIPREAGYETISGSGEEEDGDHPEQVVVEGSDSRGVYLAFWALGAGVLLSWNGLSPPNTGSRGC